MTLIGTFCLLLVCAHALGWLAERCRQPSLLGQMLAGVLLGPSILNWLKPSGALAAIADLSVLFVVITAGLEMHMRDVLSTLRGKGLVALLLGLLVPAVAAALFVYTSGVAFIPATVIVLCTSVTALPVALRILSTFGLLNTRVARVAIASALLTDVTVLLLLGILIAAATRNGEAKRYIIAGMAVAKLALLLLIVAACYFICSRLSARRKSLTTRKPLSAVDDVLIWVVIFMVGLGVVSEQLGSHFIIGAFLASLLVTGDLIGDVRLRNLEQACELMTVSVFGPAFMAYQGVQFEMGALTDGVFIFSLISIAVVSKWIGGYVMARLKALPHYDACCVAIVMNSRGVMEMVMASIAYRAGLVSQSLFSTLLIVGIITTVMTPPILRYWLKDMTKMQAMMSASESGA